MGPELHRWELHRLKGRKRTLLVVVVGYGQWDGWQDLEPGRYQETVKRGRRVLSRQNLVVAVETTTHKVIRAA